MTLGETILTCRKRAGLSQEALAERVGVSRQAVSKWELDEATPEVGKLKALAAAFGITTDQLLSGEVPPQEVPAPEERPQPGLREDRSSDRDRLPGFLAGFVRRHGWLAGVYIALQGLGVALVGGVARFAFGRMFRVAIDSFGSFGSFGGSWGMTAVDSAGNPVELPPEVMDSIYSQIGGGFNSVGSGQMTALSDMGQVFVAIATFIIIAGVAIMVAGTVLAVILYRKGRDE